MRLSSSICRALEPEGLLELPVADREARPDHLSGQRVRHGFRVLRGWIAIRELEDARCAQRSDGDAVRDAGDISTDMTAVERFPDLRWACRDRLAHVGYRSRFGPGLRVLRVEREPRRGGEGPPRGAMHERTHGEPRDHEARDESNMLQDNPSKSFV